MVRRRHVFQWTNRNLMRLFGCRINYFNYDLTQISTAGTIIYRIILIIFSPLHCCWATTVANLAFAFVFNVCRFELGYSCVWHTTIHPNRMDILVSEFNTLQQRRRRVVWHRHRHYNRYISSNGLLNCYKYRFFRCTVHTITLESFFFMFNHQISALIFMYMLYATSQRDTNTPIWPVSYSKSCDIFILQSFLFLLPGHFISDIDLHSFSSFDRERHSESIFSMHS